METDLVFCLFKIKHLVGVSELLNWKSSSLGFFFLLLCFTKCSWTAPKNIVLTRKKDYFILKLQLSSPNLRWLWHSSLTCHAYQFHSFTQSYLFFPWGAFLLSSAVHNSCCSLWVLHTTSAVRTILLCLCAWSFAHVPFLSVLIAQIQKTRSSITADSGLRLI